MTSADERRELELQTMWEVGYGAGWRAGRQKLMTQLAERVDCVEATWQTVPRPSWEQLVQERIAQMEKAAIQFRERHGIRTGEWFGRREGAA